MDMIYLDNAATTKVCLEAIKAMSISLDEFGNPSSPHVLGSIAKNSFNKSRKKMEKILNAGEGTFYFTSGATESNNWAIMGTAAANKKRGMHIITVNTEHPSVLEPIRALEKSGYEISYVKPDNNGLINIDELCSLIRDTTILVSVMHVNNETGVINDITAIGKKIKQANKDTVFHTDSVNSFCKIQINIAEIDLLSVSGHKLHAPKGIGGLYIRKGTRIAPFIYGGGQQDNMRSGTENTPYVAAFAASADICASELIMNQQKMQQLKKRLLNGLSVYDFVEIIGASEECCSSPYILNVGFRGIKSQIIINALEEKKIFVSAGSACSARKNLRNKSLEALGIDSELIDGAVRFSFSKYNTEKDIDAVLDALRNIFKAFRGLR